MTNVVRYVHQEQANSWYNNISTEKNKVVIITNCSHSPKKCSVIAKTAFTLLKYLFKSIPTLHSTTSTTIAYNYNTLEFFVSTKKILKSKYSKFSHRSY